LESDDDPRRDAVPGHRYSPGIPALRVALSENASGSIDL